VLALNACIRSFQHLYSTPLRSLLSVLAYTMLSVITNESLYIAMIITIIHTYYLIMWHITCYLSM